MKWLAHTVISVGVTDLMVMLLSRRMSAWDVVNAKFCLDALSHPETAQRMVVLLPETTLLAHRGLIIPNHSDISLHIITTGAADAVRKSYCF